MLHNKFEWIKLSLFSQAHQISHTCVNKHQNYAQFLYKKKTFYNNYELHNSRNKVELFLRPITFINDSSLQFQNTLFQILGHNPVLYKKSVP